MKPKPWRTAWYPNYTELVILLLITGQSALYSQTLDPFDPHPDGYVYAMVQQADAKFLLGGAFFTMADQGHHSVVRFSGDHSLDSAFAAWADNTVRCLCMETDGKILVGGEFGMLCGITCSRFGRLNANGTLDASFNPAPNGTVYCIAQQPDGKILFGGEFSQVAGQFRGLVSRVNANGSIDSNFRPGTVSGSAVYCLALQPDGKIILAGNFFNIGGHGCANLARLNPDGTFDGSFAPSADAPPTCLAVQPDLKILVGGGFTSLCGQGPAFIGRLNANGTVDTNFNPEVNDSVRSLGLQTDGKVLVCGDFGNVGPVFLNGIARLHADGTLDATFDAGANSYLDAVAALSNGSLLLGGNFTGIGNGPRQWFGALTNTEPASQNVVYDGSRVTWLMSPTTPCPWRTAFDFTTNGTSWISLGAGTLTADGWQSSATSLPTNATIRARGFVTAGEYNGSSWFLQSTGLAIIRTRPRIIVDDAQFGLRSGQFGFNVSASPGQVVVLEASTDLLNWSALATNTLSSSSFYFTDPQTGTFPTRCYRVFAP